VPGDGQYEVGVRAEPPAFDRHDETNSDRYGETVEVTFADVESRPVRTDGTPRGASSEFDSMRLAMCFLASPTDILY